MSRLDRIVKWNGFEAFGWRRPERTFEDEEKDEEGNDEEEVHVKQRNHPECMKMISSNEKSTAKEKMKHEMERKWTNIRSARQSQFKNVSKKKKQALAMSQMRPVFSQLQLIW